MSSSFPKPFQSQYSLRGETMTCYGSDFRGIIQYNFNSQGYRSDFDFELSECDPLALCFGSSIATGHGLPFEQSFGSIVAKHYDLKLWNLGQGCFRSSNKAIQDQIEFLVQTELNINVCLIQFTHINRYGNTMDSYLDHDQDKNIKNFELILRSISNSLMNKKWAWFLCDYSQAEFTDYVVNHPNKIAIDPEVSDHVSVKDHQHLAPTTHALKMLSLHPGSGWHSQMAQSFIDKLQ